MRLKKLDSVYCISILASQILALFNVKICLSSQITHMINCQNHNESLNQHYNITINHQV